MTRRLSGKYRRPSQEQTKKDDKSKAVVLCGAMDIQPLHTIEGMMVDTITEEIMDVTIIEDIMIESATSIIHAAIIREAMSQEAGQMTRRTPTTDIRVTAETETTHHTEQAIDLPKDVIAQPPTRGAKILVVTNHIKAGGR